MKLYEIHSEIQHLLDMAEQNDGELDDATVYALERLDLAREDKILNAARAIKAMTAEADAVKSEEDKLKSRRVSINKRLETFKAWLSSYMQEGEKIKDATCSIGWRKSESVVIDVDPDELPEKYQRVKVEANKSILKDDLKAGLSINGCRIESKQNMQIR